MGCCSGAGASSGKFKETLREKKVHCRPIPAYLFQTDLLYPAFIMNNEILSPAGNKLLEQSNLGYSPDQLNRTVLLAIEATAQALHDAGLSPQNLHNKRVGIALGTTVGCTFHDEHYYIEWRHGNLPAPDPVFHYLNANLATVLQDILGVKGPAAVITNACASGTDAIGIARDWLNQDCCDITLAGGADALSRDSILRVCQFNASVRISLYTL